MGKLVDGVWTTRWNAPKQSGGQFVRPDTSFRGRLPAAELGRYHLYASLACPWAHRTLIFRKLKGLEAAVSVSVVEPLMLDNGWAFSDQYPDRVLGKQYLHQIYVEALADYTGRVTVPVLWDNQTGTIVNNESAEIIRIFNSEFGDLADPSVDYYPEALRDDIDAVNARVYDTVNNGVYKCGFARSQEAYDEAVDALFGTLDMLERRVTGSRYLVGDTETEADWRLFTTLVRFDPVYHGHFKCNVRRLIEYPNLYAYLKRLYAVPGIAETVDLDYTRRHYYGSHETINPSRVVARGPATWL